MKFVSKSFFALAFLGVAAGCEPVPIVSHSVKIDVDGDGFVRVLPDDEICEDGDRCVFSYDAGSFVSLVAVPDPGSLFLGWGGDCADSEVNTVVDLDVVAEMTCTASFELDPVLVAQGPLLSVDVLGPGTVTSEPANIDCSGTDAAHAVCESHFVAGTSVLLRATPVAGATLIGFNGDCAAFDNGDGTANVVLDEDLVCGVTFIEDDVQFPVRIDVEGEGTVTSSPSGISCGTAGAHCDVLFGPTDDVTLNVELEEGWGFAGWGHSCELFGVETSIYIGPVTFGLACSARFERTFFIDIAGEGSVQAETVDGPFDCASFLGSCQTPSLPSRLTATAAEGSLFVRWEGDCDGTEPTTTVDEADARCTAVFERLPPTLTVELTGPGRVVAEPELDIDCPGDCSVEGTGGGGGGVDPGPGVWVCPFEFQGDGSCDCGCGVPDPDCETSSSSVCSFCSDGCAFECADIAPNQNHLCLTGADPIDSLNRSLRAIPDEGAVFMGWGGDCFGAAATTSISTTEQATCTALFALGMTVVVTGPGSVSPDVGNDCTTSCSLAPLPSALTAVADANARFVSWSGDCAGTLPAVVIEATDRTCTAVFEEIPLSIEVSIVGAGRVVTEPELDIDCPGDCVAEGAGGGITVDPGPGTWVCSLSFQGSGDGCDCGCGAPDPDCASSSSTCSFCEGCSNGDCTAIAPTQNHLCLIADDPNTFGRTLRAIPDDGAVFLGWSGDCLGPALTATVSTTSQAACTASFGEALGLSIVDADVGVGGTVLALDPAGHLLVSVDEGRVQLLDTATGHLRSSFALSSSDIVDPVSQAVVDDAGRLLVIDDDRTAYLMQGLAPGAAVALVGHSDRITGGALDAVGTLAATSDALGRVKIWSQSTGLVQRTLVAHTGSAVGVGFVGGFVVSAGVDGRLVSHRPTSNTLVDEEGPFAAAPITALATAAAQVLVGAEDGSLSLYDVDAAGLFVLARSTDLSAPVARLSLGNDIATALVEGQLLAIDLADLSTRNLGAATDTLASSSLILKRATSSGGVELLSADGIDRSLRAFAVDIGTGLRSTAVVAGRALFVAGVNGLFVYDDARTVLPSIAALDLAPAATGFIFASLAEGGIDRVAATTGVATSVTEDDEVYARIAANPSGDLIAGTLAAFGGADDHVRVLEASTGDRFRGFAGNGDAVDLAFLDDDTLVFLLDAGTVGTLRVVRISDAAIVDDVALPFSPSRFCIDGAQIIVGGGTSAGRGRVVRVDATNRANLLLGAPIDLDDDVSAVLALPAGLVVAARAPGSLSIVDLNDGVVHPPLIIAPAGENQQRLRGYVHDLDAFDGDVLASTDDGVVRLRR